MTTRSLINNAELVKRVRVNVLAWLMVDNKAKPATTMNIHLLKKRFSVVVVVYN